VGDPTTTNKVAQPLPSDDRKTIATFDFVSGGVRRKWLQMLPAVEVRNQIRRLQDAKEDIATRDAIGRSFEAWVLGQFQTKPHLSRRLVHTAKEGVKTPTALEPWDIPEVSVVTFPGDDPSKVHKPESGVILFIPSSCKFPVVDAIIVTDKGAATLIQVTVGHAHKPPRDATKTLFDELKKKGLSVESFVWVVDATSRLATKQDVDGAPTVSAYDNADHYICRVDPVMCWVCRRGKKPCAFQRLPVVWTRLLC
jgi:hypothetical protein